MERFHFRVETAEDVEGIRTLIDAWVHGLQSGAYSLTQIGVSLKTVFAR